MLSSEHDNEKEIHAAMNASMVTMLAMSETGRPQKSNGGVGKSGQTTTSPKNNVAASTVIWELNPNDVIQGRGTGTAIYEGNVKFRKLIKEYKEEYMSAETKRERKAKIANKIFNLIRSRGGRFVRKEKERKVRGVVVSQEVYHGIEDEVALEKCKQALRQLHGCDERRSDGSRARQKRADVQATRKRAVQPKSTTQASPLTYDESVYSQIARLETNQLRRIEALKQSKPPAMHERTRPPMDSSSARMLLLRRAQIAAQKKADLYKHALMQLASEEETIGASLPVVGHLNAAFAYQAMSSLPSFSPTQSLAVPQSLLQDLDVYRLVSSTNECLRHQPTSATRHEAAQPNFLLPQGRFDDSPSETLDREEAAIALSVLAMAADRHTL